MPWDAKIDLRSGRYDFLISSLLKDAPEDLILNLNGTVFLKGSKKYISGSSIIKHVMLSMYGYSFTNEQDIMLALEDKKLDLNRIKMRSGNTSLSVSGGLIIGEEYNLLLEGNSSLAPFKSLSDKIELLRGDAEFVLSIAGNWETPKINGGLSISNGSFGLKDYYYRISSLNGFLYIDEDRVVLSNLSGETGGGDIDITGILYLKKFSFRRFYVEAKFRDITSTVSKDFNVNFGGDILYKGTPESQVVSGDINIIRVTYKERIEWKSWLLKVKEIERHKAEISDLEKAELNIRISGKDNIEIDNNVARATVSSELLLRGTIYRPVLFGRLESREGTVYFRNNEFRILRASADFSDIHRNNPFLEIAGETIVEGYKISMNLEGQADQFNLSLSSDPPLQEMDVLALLTVGRTGGELKGLEGGIGAGEATSFVTGKIQDVIEERVRTLTGLDRLQIDPYVSKTTGTVEPRVTVAKRLLGEKIFVTYSTSLGSVEEQIIKLEYVLNKSVSLVGIRDERGFLGGDVRFRFEFK
jgi:translocation and assembly module TamB